MVDAVVLVLVAVAVVVAVAAVFALSKKPAEAKPAAAAQPKTEKDKKTTTRDKKEKEKEKEKHAHAHAQAATHPWCAAVLKGHTANITDIAFSPADQHLASCADDRQIRLWPVQHAEWQARFTEKQSAVSSSTSRRINVDFDEPSRLHFSPDALALLAGLSSSRKARVFKLGKTSTPVILDFPQDKPPTHGDLIAVGIAGADSHKYMMTAYGDTTLCIWSLKGQLLHKIDSKLVANTHAAVSPSGRFVAVSGFTPEVHIYEVTSSGSEAQAAHVMNLTGHKSGVLHFAFSNDSTRMVSVSKDGTWRLYNIDVRYQAREDCHLLASGRYEQKGSENHTVVGVSPDGRAVVVGSGHTLQVFASDGPDAGKLVETIEQTSTVSRLAFDATSMFFACNCGRQINVFLNVVGLRLKLAAVTKQLQQTDKVTLKERLQEQVDSLKRILSGASSA